MIQVKTLCRLGLYSTTTLIVLIALLIYTGFVTPLGPDAQKHSIRGVDVSHHQGLIDWKLVASNNIRFAYIKATEGGDFRDPQFEVNWKESHDAGIERGGYHIFTYCRSGLDQARNVIAFLPNEPGSLPPSIDLTSGQACSERLAVPDLIREFNVFRSQIESFYGRPPIYYVNDILGRQSVLLENSETRLWTRGLLVHPNVFVGDRWLFWQYKVTGQLPGISTYVDLNVFNGNEEKWLQIVRN